MSEDEVIGTEDLAIGTSADGVHGSGLQVHQNSAGDIASSGGLIEVDVDTLQLEVGVALVGSGGVDAVLVGDALVFFVLRTISRCFSELMCDADLAEDLSYRSRSKRIAPIPAFRGS